MVFTGSIDSFSGNLEIYEGQGTSGNLIHKQAYAGITGFQAWKSFHLTALVQLNAGELYTIRFTNIIWAFANDAYSGG